MVIAMLGPASGVASAARRRARAGKGMGELRSIQRVNIVKECDRIAHLVGLQRPDQVQFKTTHARIECRKLDLGLLYPVLAEAPLPSLDQRLDRFGPMRLGDRDEMGDRCRLDAALPRSLDARHNGIKAALGIL